MPGIRWGLVLARKQARKHSNVSPSTHGGIISQKQPAVCPLERFVKLPSPNHRTISIQDVFSSLKLQSISPYSRGCSRILPTPADEKGNIFFGYYICNNLIELITLNPTSLITIFRFTKGPIVMLITSSSNSTSTHSNFRQGQTLHQGGSVHSNLSQASSPEQRSISPIPRHIIIDWLQLPDVFQAVVADPEQTQEPAHFQKLRETLKQNPLTSAEIFGDNAHPPNPKLKANLYQQLMQEMLRKTTPKRQTTATIEANPPIRRIPQQLSWLLPQDIPPASPSMESERLSGHFSDSGSFKSFRLEDDTSADSTDSGLAGSSCSIR